MNYTDFRRPRSLSEARAWLQELGDEGQPVAGSTLHVFLRDEKPKVAVDLSALGLDTITAAEGAFDIGATTTVTDLYEYRQTGWVLDRMAAAFVTQPIRNMATIGGSIVRVFPWSDIPVALLALDAEMVIAGDTEKRMAATDFFATQPFHHLAPGDLLTRIRVPALRAGEGFGYHKERRTTTDFSRCTVAVGLRCTAQGTVDAVRIALGAAVPLARRLPAMETALTGKRPTEKNLRAAVDAGLDEPRWRGLHGISDEYARHLASIHIVDALQAAASEAQSGDHA